MAERKKAAGKGRVQQEIVVSKDGPYFVSGSIPLEKGIIVRGEDGIPREWKTGERYPPRESYALCRCGESKDKPYCDGTHIKIHFSGTETSPKTGFSERAKRLKGPGGDLTDCKELCSRLQFCHRAGGVWDLVEGTGDPETMKLMTEIAGNCAAGRLTPWDKQGNPLEPEHERSISVVEDPGRGVSGPLWVKGRVPIICSDGNPYEPRNRVTLCRCGRSKNKAFCDGTHVATGFNDGSL